MDAAAGIRDFDLPQIRLALERIDGRAFSNRMRSLERDGWV
jgi:hypothetical protein